VSEVATRFGPITGILHGAAINDPQLLSSLDQSTFLRTVAIKVEGARNLLAAVDPTHLRLFVAFGSIIARTGLRGEAHYGLANEWLTRLTEQFQNEHPTCRCLAVEWSAWSGVGMAERLGGVEALARAGMTPITPDQGVSMLRHLLMRPLPTVSVVVTGRVGNLPTLKVEQPELPLRRFLERPRVYYPDLELVADAELSTDTDPYLDDHVFQGSRLFPAVMGLEAMAQAAMALAGSSEPPVFGDVKFNRPVVVPTNSHLTIRVAALVRAPGCVEVVVRSQETSFQVDHFQATCRFDAIADGDRSKMTPPRPEGRGLQIPEFPGHVLSARGTDFRPMRIADCLEDLLPTVPFDPERDLYGGLLFHSGRFRRLCAYRRLRATECIAEIAPPEGLNPQSAIRNPQSNDWFGRYLPAQLVLGDPAARDAAVHAIQACIPHATLLPIGVDRLILSADHSVGPRFVHARERERDGDIFIYDLEVTTADGRVIERWEGLRLRIVGDAVTQGTWVEPLLGPYVERRLKELIPASTATVVVERNGEPDRRARSDLAIQRALGKRVPVRRRPDGKPEIAGDQDVSAAHAGDLSMAVVGIGPIGCDVEPVAPRPAQVWRDLLGPERFTLAEVLARELGEDQNVAATRVWAASECLKKAGAIINAPLVLVSSSADGWVLLAAGPLTIATFVAPVRGVEGKLALAVLVRGNHARL
jgi:enediyne polyketide synthase